MKSSSEEFKLTEYRKCKSSPVYFLATYAKIEDPTIRKTVNWEPWPYLVDLIDKFEDNREVIIGKARQLGISWLVCGYALWMVLFHTNARVLMFSQDEESAWEMVSKCRFMLANLPPFLQRELNREGRGGFKFSSNSSEVRALSSASNAGTGYTASLVIRDELDKHPNGRENFAAVGPTVDAGQGKMIDLSTRDKSKADSHFMERWFKAKTGEIKAIPVFLSWRLRPIREEGVTLDEWFSENIRKKYDPFQIEQEYPETQEEFESEAQTVRLFNKEGVDFIRRDCYDPIEIDGTVRIWERPVEGRKYASFIDTSDGSDPHAAGWLDVQSNRLVCVSHGKTTAEECAVIFDKYNRYYNNAFNEFELNGASGLKVAQVLLDLQTPNRRVTGVSKDRKNKYGWWTGGNMNSAKNVRNLMLDGLEEAVRNRRLRMHYAKIPNELDSMMRKEGDSPRVPRGKSDDLIMMLGGLWQIRRESQVYNHAPIKPGKCVGF